MKQKNIYTELLDLLSQHKELSAGKKSIHKNKAYELALKYDSDLIAILLSSPNISKMFFTKVGDVTIFHKEKFVELLYNKEFLPDSYTKYSQKIGLTNGNDFIMKGKEVVLNWPYKDCVLEGGMTKEDADRDEIFWNETIAPEQITRLYSPKAFMNAKRIGGNGTKEFKRFNRNQEGIIQDNLIIKGNNLLALHSLKEQFRGKVKLIYIDPPYNTGNDGFNYNDRFNHSSWLTFMKNRLEIASELLASDGIIFVQCDDNERNYLQILMDEIFDRKNNICSIAVRTASINGFKIYANKPVRIKETIFMYARDKDKYKYTRVYTQQKGKWDEHYNRYVEKIGDVAQKLREVLVSNGIMGENDRLGDLDIDNGKFKEFYIANKDKIFQTGAHKNEEYKSLSLKNPERVIRDAKTNNCYYNGRMVSFLSASLHEVNGNLSMALALSDLWDDIDFNNVQNEGGVGFTQGRKPEALIKRFIETSTSSGDIVLDFFLGSGTTAALAHKMGRQYIGVEQMDYIEEITYERMKKVIKGDKGGISKIVNWQGGGDFVCMELAEWNQQWIRKIKKLSSKEESWKLWKKLQKDAFLSYKVGIDKINANISEFESLSLSDQKKFLLDAIDVNHLYINYSEIGDTEYKMDQKDKDLSHNFYNK